MDEVGNDVDSNLALPKSLHQRCCGRMAHLLQVTVGGKCVSLASTCDMQRKDGRLM